jgi:hypothetical protein
MTISTSNVDTSQTFGSWLAVTNKLAKIATQNAVTVDSTTGGSSSTGNGFISGSFGASILFANTSISGGNVSSFANLIISSNAVFNTNVFVTGTANASSFTVGSSVVVNTAGVYTNIANATTFSAGLNFTANSSMVNAVSYVSGVDYIANSSSIKMGTVLANTTAVIVGTSTTNTYHTSSVISAASPSSSANVSATGFVVGISSMNSTTYSVGANVFANSSTLYIGNSLSNSYINSTSLYIGGASVVNGNLTVLGTVTATGISGGNAPTGNLTPSIANTWFIGNSIYYYANSYVINQFSNVITTNTITTNSITSNTISVSGNSVFFNIAPSVNVTYTSGNTTNYWLTTFSNTIQSNVVFAITANLTNLNTTGTSNLAANVAVGGVLQLGNTSTQSSHLFSNSYVFINTSSPTAIDAFATTLYRSVEYMVQMTDTTRGAGANAFHVTKILIIHDNSSAYLTEYGTIFTGSGLGSTGLGSFDVVVNAGTASLTLSPTTANVTARFVRTSLVL